MWSMTICKTNELEQSHKCAESKEKVESMIKNPLKVYCNRAQLPSVKQDDLCILNMKSKLDAMVIPTSIHTLPLYNINIVFVLCLHLVHFLKSHIFSTFFLEVKIGK